MSNFIIRKPNFDEVANFLKVSFQSFDRPIPNNIKKLEKLIIDLIKSEIAIFLVTEVNQQIIGLGGVFLFDKVCSIGYMGVLEPYRSKGIGTEIFENLFEIAKKCGCKTFNLYASKFGEPIYKKFSFESRFFEQMYELPSNFSAYQDKTAQVKIINHLPEWICNLDKETIGYDRSKYIRIRMNHGSILLKVENKGYSLLSGKRFGPLIATSVEAALTLIQKGIELGADHIIIPNHPLLPKEFFNFINLNKLGENRNQMMTLGQELSTNIKNLYAIGTYAKG